MEAQHVEFKKPDQKEHLVFGLDRKVETKRELARETGSNQKKGKWKKPVQVPVKFGKDFVFQENLQEDAELSGHYSPMDVSPYEETLADNTDEGLVSATEGLYINECDVKGSEVQDEESTCCVNESIRVESPEEDAVSGAETESFKSANDELDHSTDSFITAAHVEGSSSSSIERQDNDGGTLLKFDTSLADIGQTSFILVASSTALISHASSHFSHFQFSESSLTSPKKGQKGNLSTLSSQRKGKSEQVKELDAKQDSIAAASMAAQESCEKLRVSCYLALGEVENATLHFMKCLRAGSDVCAERRLLIEASEGLEWAQDMMMHGSGFAKEVDRQKQQFCQGLFESSAVSADELV
ncbi:hypothetical protein Pfo_006668 [Paulownia fortunei]|nr:hypothetical protein Pfo_006668 [Paulownia fortunei]